MSNIQGAFEAYIKGTPPKAIVANLTILFCTLTNKVQRVCRFETTKVHITTRILKKNYDKRPAEENDFIIEYGWKIVRFPDHIYENKNAKRGSYVFAKRMKNELYLASIEVSKDGSAYMLYAVSTFRLRKENYLKTYKLIWSWKGGEPSS